MFLLMLAAGVVGGAVGGFLVASGKSPSFIPKTPTLVTAAGVPIKVSVNPTSTTAGLQSTVLVDAGTPGATITLSWAPTAAITEVSPVMMTSSASGVGSYVLHVKSSYTTTASVTITATVAAPGMATQTATTVLVVN